MAGGFDIGSVVAHVTADIGDFKKKFEEAQGVASGFKNGLSNVAGAIETVSKQSMILAGVVGGALVIAAKTSVDAFNEADQIMKQTEAVIKSTGGAAGMTTASILKLSSALQQQSVFSDDAIQSSSNLLLTFTRIGKTIFPEAQKAVLDMSQALGQDLKSSSIQLGKALQDPILGVTALRRVGIMLTQEQEDQVKTLMASGKQLEAQKIILKEISTEFGGSALNATKTFGGQLQMLKNDINNIQEKIGEFIAVALGPLVAKFREFVVSDQVQNFFTQLPGMFQKLQEALKPLTDWIMANQELVLTFIKGLAIALAALVILGTVTALLTALTNPLVLVALLIGALYTAWSTNFLGIRDITTQVVSVIIDNWNNWLKPALDSLVAFFVERWDFISTYLKGVWEVISGIVIVAWALISGIIGAGLLILTGQWGAAWELIKAKAGEAWEGLKRIFSGIVDMIKGWGGMVVHELTKPFEDAWNSIKNTVNKIKDALDFTKRHSPSVIDIIERGVDLANSAYSKLDFPIPSINPSPNMAYAGTPSGMATSINIDLTGSVISDEAGAMRIGEKIGDSIVRKLQTNIRF